MASTSPITSATAYLPEGREPFGFRDGISQPAIRDPHAGPHRRGPSHVEIAPGEFVLGYAGRGRIPLASPGPREERHVRSGPQARAGRRWLLGLHPTGRPARTDVARNGWRRSSSAAGATGPRRRSRPIGRSVRPHASPEAVNDFRYADDPRGHRCPIGAHIRRTNPRDGLDADMKLTLRHRIIRRGMPYPASPADPLPGADVRLLSGRHPPAVRVRPVGVVQPRRGVRPRQRPGPACRPPRGKLTIQGRPPMLIDAASFVRTRGGGYFLVPGIEALRHIGQVAPRSRCI